MAAPGTDFSPTDEQLSAWLDGELPGAEQQRVQDWLQARPEQAAHVRLWAADREALRTRADAMLLEPMPEHLTQLVLRGGPRPGVAPGPVWQRPWAQAAAAAGLVVAGALAGGAWVARGQPDPLAAQRQAAATRVPAEAAAALPDWVGRATAAHAVYVPELRHPVEVSVQEGDPAQRRAQEEHLVKWLSKRVAMPVKLFDLSAHGFALVGGRLLPDGTSPGAQLMYEDGSGVRVTAYMRKPVDNPAVSFRYSQQGDMGSWYWAEPGYGCALVGRLPRERLLAIAETMYKQYEAHEHQAAPTPR